MIRSFSKDGLVLRSFVSCQQTRFISLRTGFYNPLFGRGRLRSPYRIISTSPEHTSPEATKSHVPSTNPRKHKLELRPSPVKPPPILTNLEPPPPLSLDPPTTQSQQKEQSAKSSTSVADTIIENTKYDYEQARRHGILVPAPANASKIGKLWHQAKEIFKFYIRGIKLINTHRKHVNTMLTRVNSGGAPLTRWEVRFIRTYREDTRKLIPFLLILVVIEEILPLVVLYAPFMLPSTCVLPSQQERILLKQRERVQMYAASNGSNFQRILIRGNSPALNIPLEELVTREERLAMCGILSLPTPFPFRLNRIKRCLQRITEDDALLNREGMDQRLTLPELQEALDERGFVTNGLDKVDMQAKLRWWLTSVEKDFATWDSASKRALLIARVNAGDEGKQW